MSFLAIAASTLLPKLAEILDKVIPDPEAKARAQLELFKMQQEGSFKELDAQLQTSLAQSEVNKADAMSGSAFQAGWRPLAGYMCVAGMGYEFLIRPILPWVLVVSGVDAPDLPSLDSVLFELIFGMLGLGTLRTADKWKRVNALKP